MRVFLGPLIFICPVIPSLSHSCTRSDVSAPARPLYELQQCPAVDTGIVHLMAKYIASLLLQNGREDESDSAVCVLFN